MSKSQTPSWSKQDEAVLAKHYAKYGTNIPTLLSKKTPGAIRAKAKRMGLLGSTTTNSPASDSNDLSKEIVPNSTEQDEILVLNHVANRLTEMRPILIHQKEGTLGTKPTDFINVKLTEMPQDEVKEFIKSLWLSAKNLDLGEIRHARLAKHYGMKGENFEVRHLDPRTYGSMSVGNLVMLAELMSSATGNVVKIVTIMDYQQFLPILNKTNKNVHVPVALLPTTSSIQAEETKKLPEPPASSKKLSDLVDLEKIFGRNAALKVMVSGTNGQSVTITDVKDLTLST